jgi:hypothetical protein
VIETGCIGCGATVVVGYTIERKPGPFCRQCWDAVKRHVADVESLNAMSNSELLGYGSFVETLQAFVIRLECDFAHHQGFVFMKDGSCTDMSGCVNLFRAIDPDVRVVFTMSGEQRSTTYEKLPDGTWRAQDPKFLGTFQPQVIKFREAR